MAFERWGGDAEFKFTALLHTELQYFTYRVHYRRARLQKQQDDETSPDIFYPQNPLLGGVYCDLPVVQFHV